MRKVAALAALAVLNLLAAAPSPAGARAAAHHPASKHTHAAARCVAVRVGHRSKRHVSYRCRVGRRQRTHRARAHFAIINKPLHRLPQARQRSGATRGNTPAPAQPQPHSSSPQPTSPAEAAPAPAPPVHCDAFASPLGSDSGGDGTIGKPFASVDKLDASLTPGQTGCLRAGTYGNTASSAYLSRSGVATARVTITAYPGESATIAGYVSIDAAYTTLSHLNIDGSNTLYDHQRAGTNCPYPVSEALSISGANDILEYDNYYQSVASLRGNGIGIGFSGSPDNTVIRFNKIHDVGGCDAYDHLIYLSHGNNVQIYDNWMWNDPHGWGVQLYPAPTNASVWGNVIDGAGAGFTVGNEQGDTVSGNRIWSNVVSNSTGLPTAHEAGVAISDYWGGSPGQGNTFSGNDSYDNPGGVASVSDVAVAGNTTANPDFVDAANHDYTVRAGSPAASWGLWTGS